MGCQLLSRAPIYRRIIDNVNKRGYDIALLENVIRMLADGETLPAKCRDHTLTGNYSGFRECHIIPFGRRVLNA